MRHAQKNNTLLLVDDDDNILKSLVRTLSPSGYQIHTFTRPFDALEMLRSIEVGVIVADQCMPQMDGSEFLCQAGRLQPDAVRIALTGYADADYVVRAAQGAEAWRYLTKPWGDDELCATVAGAFRRFAR